MPHGSEHKLWRLSEFEAGPPHALAMVRWNERGNVVSPLWPSVSLISE